MKGIDNRILGCFCCLTFWSSLPGEIYVVRLGQWSILNNFEHPKKSSSTSDVHLKILRHPYKLKKRSCLKVWHANYQSMCIDPHNTNSEIKIIYLSCSTRNVQKTSYFFGIDENDKNRRGFFLHFSSCMRDKLILSLDLCYGDQCTYFDKSHAILLDNFIFSLHKGVAVGRLSLRTLKIGENIPLT